ncbi:MAG: hypothetical protein ILP02_03580 [Clostridia bacterium]|nr:hypothetical protein [Clostridia bacterium]
MSLNNKKDRDITVKFDMARPPKKQAWYLKPLAWALCIPELIARHSKVRKHGCKGLKPPYLLLCTHAAFLDFKVATKAMFPHGATYVVAIDGFIGREGIMRKVGCIATRKFISDTTLVKNLKYSIDVLKQTVVVYPEARYSISGTTAILPPSLGKLARLLSVPVAVLNTHGHYINSSVWNLKPKKVPVDADFTVIAGKDEVRALSAEDINARIKKAFYYDEFAWQKEKGVLVKDKNRAKGLEKVLYKCPHCEKEHLMRPEGDVLYCGACKKEYRYNEDGSISAVEGETEFSRIPDWYEWERSCVRKEIELGQYRTEDDVDVDSLPNSKGFIAMGKGHFVHDENGLKVTFKENGVDKTFVKTVAENYSCHIEFDYNDKGDCVSFSKGDDTYYFYFRTLKNVIVKVHFAVEELFRYKVADFDKTDGGDKNA